MSDVVVGQPYQELDSTGMYYYNAGKLQWKLDSKHMKKVLADTGLVMANPVKLSVYDSLGKETSQVLSDSGSTDGPMKKFWRLGKRLCSRAETGCASSPTSLTGT